MGYIFFVLDTYSIHVEKRNATYRLQIYDIVVTS